MLNRFIKKTLTIVLLLSLSWLVHAERPYNMAVGMMAGTFEGASLKLLVADHVLMQGDAGFRFATANIGGQNWGFWDAEFNPNFVYQNNIQTWRNGTLLWLGGVGLSLGDVLYCDYYHLTDDRYSKFGLNGLVGSEFAMKNIPMSFQLDFRPGYGLLMGDDNHSFFDWAVTLAMKFTFQ